MTSSADDEEIILRVMAWTRDELEARRWYREQPLPGNGNMTAEALVEAGRGDAVLRHLARLGAGGYA